MKYLKYFLLLVLLIPFINVKALTLQNKLISGSSYLNNCSMKIPNTQSSCNASVTSNSNGQISLYEDSSYMKRYFYIWQDSYSGTSLHPYYYILTADTPFYLVVGNTGNSRQKYVTSYSTKTEITQTEYNDLYNNGYKSSTYYDIENNKYYKFTQGNTLIPVYRIYDNYWGVNPVSPYMTDLLLINGNIEVYFYDYSNTQKNIKMYNTLTNNIVSYNVRLHLNGGTAWYYRSGGNTSVGVHDGDYTITVSGKEELNTYLDSLTIKNDIAIFKTWYYDSALTLPYNESDTLTGDIDLYASYEYISVDSIISNITFDSYTFPDEYEYAILSVKEDFYKGMYIGLGFDFSFLSVYSYDIVNQVFMNGTQRTLSSIGSKNNIYYYHLSDLDSESAKVIVLDKGKLIKLGVNNEIEHYYQFFVSSNTYVEFTNDLTQIGYYIPSGNGTSTKLENQNILPNYEEQEKFILSSNTDLASLLLGLSKESDFSIFNYFTQLWYKFRAYKIYNYFMFLFISGIVVAIIKGASRH